MNRKNLLRVVCIFMLVTTFATFAFAAQAETGTINTDFARIRLDNETSDILGQFRKGDTFNVIDKDKFWVYYYYNGLRCKTYREYVDLSNTSSSSSSNTSSNSSSKKVNTTEYNYYKFGRVELEKGSTVNVRKSATLKSSILGTLEEYTTVTVYGEKGDFYKIKYNGKDAFVQKPFMVLLDGIVLPECDPTVIDGKTYLNETGLMLTMKINDYGEIVFTAQEWPEGY